MSTTKQKQAARRNIVIARRTKSARAQGAHVPRRQGLSAAEQGRLPGWDFAFPRQPKEPLTDAKHVRNAIARFGQVEEVSDRERDAAWKRIEQAAGRFHVHIGVDGWRELGRMANRG